MEETSTVYRAINAVQKALSKAGISKARKNAQQGYHFRGIDDIYNVVSPLLAEHGLCILPRVLSRECTERATKSGSVLFYVVIDAEFDFVASEDGSRHVVKTWGEAMDSADKATNKAMSAAYKYAVMQAFAIPTEGDNDADAHTPEPAPKKDTPEKLTADLLSDHLKAIAATKSMEGLQAAFTEATRATKDAEQRKQIIAAKDARKAALSQSADPFADAEDDIPW